MSKINGIAILEALITQRDMISVAQPLLEKTIMKVRQVSDPRTVRQTITFLIVNDFLIETNVKGFYKLNFELINKIKDKQLTLTNITRGEETP